MKCHRSGHNSAKPQTKSRHDDKKSSQKVASDKHDNGKSEQRFPKFRKGSVCYYC